MKQFRNEVLIEKFYHPPLFGIRVVVGWWQGCGVYWRGHLSQQDVSWEHMRKVHGNANPTSDLVLLSVV